MPLARTQQVGVLHPRCPFCHEPVRPEEPKSGCLRCMAWQHAACWADHGRCATCAAAPPAPHRARARPHRELIVLGAALVGALGFGLGYPRVVDGRVRLQRALPAGLLGLMAGAVVAAQCLRAGGGRRRADPEAEPRSAEKLDELEAEREAASDREAELERQLADAHVLVAWEALEAGDEARAARHAARVLACAGSDPARVAYSRGVLAVAAEGEGQLERALTERRALAADPDLSRRVEPFAWMELARLEALVGDRAAAFECAREYARHGDAIYAWLFVAALGGDRSPLERCADPAQWSHQLARFMVGTLDAEALLRAASGPAFEGPEGPTERERVCEAHGWIGLRADRDGELVTARQHYEACVETGAEYFFEHGWARMRLRQLEEGGPIRSLSDPSGT